MKMLHSFKNQRYLKFLFYMFLVMFLPGYTPISLSLSVSTEAGSVCNERRCAPRNPFAETYHVVQDVKLKHACQVTLEQPVCKKVKNKEDLKNCDHPDDLMPAEKASATYVMGCMLGVQSFAEGMWEMAKMGGRLAVNAAKMPFSPKTREKWQRDYNAKFVPAKEKFVSFIKSSYRKKYAKHRKRYARGSTGDLWASVRVAESVFPGLWSKVMGGLSEKIESFSCMNRVAQTRMGCTVMSELGFEFVPAMMTGGMTLAVGMAIKAKKGSKLVDILEADTPSSSVSGPSERAVAGDSNTKRGNRFSRSGNSEEALLAEKGFKQSHINGLDHIKREAEFGEELRVLFREGKFDPKKTHVQAYADQVEDLLDYIEDGIKYRDKDYDRLLNAQLEQNKKILSEIDRKMKMPQYADRLDAIEVFKERRAVYQEKVEELLDEIKHKRLMVSSQEVHKVLADFKKEARERIKNNNVTYDWWTKFQFRSSFLSSSLNVETFNHRWWKIHFNREDLLNKYKKETEHADNKDLGNYILNFAQLVENEFSDIYVSPTTKDLGIMAFNEADGTKILPIGISNRTGSVDGLTNELPFVYAGHDVLHYYITDFGNKNGADFWKFFTDKKKNLSKEEREKVEAAYFLRRHELGGGEGVEVLDMLISNKKDISGDPIITSFVSRLQDSENLAGVLPAHVDHTSREQVENYLLDSMKSFGRLKDEFDSTRPKPKQNAAPREVIPAYKAAYNQYYNKWRLLRKDYDLSPIKFRDITTRHHFLMENRNGADFFHGSNSASLLSVIKGKQGLTPTGRLIENPKNVPFSGEVNRGVTIRDGEMIGMNKEKVSFTNLENVDTAIDFSTKIKPWTPAHARDCIEKGEECSQVIEKMRLERWKTLSQSEKDMITQSYPVLYGVTPSSTRNFTDVASQLRETVYLGNYEVGIKNGVGIEEIKVVFVPKNKVEEVKAMLEPGSEIQVLPIEPVQKSSLPPEEVYERAQREHLKNIDK